MTTMLKERLHAAVDRLVADYEAVIGRETFITRRELRDLADSAVHGAAAIDEQEALAILADTPSLLTEAMILPAPDHYACRTILGQIKHLVLLKGLAAVEPVLPDLLLEQFGDDADLRDELLAAADAAFSEYQRIEEGRVPRQWALEEHAILYPARRADFDRDPDAFIETASKFTSYCYRERLDKVRKRFVVALEAWRWQTGREAA